jgi:hypothetical protein
VSQSGGLEPPYTPSFFLILTTYDLDVRATGGCVHLTEDAYTFYNLNKTLKNLYFFFLQMTASCLKIGFSLYIFSAFARCSDAGYKASSVMSGTCFCFKANYNRRKKRFAEIQCNRENGTLVQIDSAIKHSAISQFIKDETLPGML